MISSPGLSCTWDHFAASSIEEPVRYVDPQTLCVNYYQETFILHYLFPDHNAEASQNRNFRCELLGLLGDVEKGLEFRNPNTLETSLTLEKHKQMSILDDHYRIPTR